MTPFAVGASTAYLYNRGRQVTPGETVSLVLMTALMAGITLFLVALEGAICLVMAMPLAIPLALLGGMVGRWAATSDPRQTSPAMFMLLALPLTAAIEPASGHVMHEVRSSVIIDAAPDAVWPHVVAFREIPDPTDWVFRAGVAYPVRARIDGSGVGAVRYCVFSTGSFIEPITQWEPGRRLSFDVVDSPAPMNELSLYRHVSPPHLHGYLRPKRGEFRFIGLADGRTRLEGSTWYEDRNGAGGVLADVQRRADSPYSPARARSHQTGSGIGRGLSAASLRISGNLEHVSHALVALVTAPLLPSLIAPTRRALPPFHTQLSSESACGCRVVMLRPRIPMEAADICRLTARRLRGAARLSAVVSAARPERHAAPAAIARSGRRNGIPRTPRGHRQLSCGAIPAGAKYSERVASRAESEVLTVAGREVSVSNPGKVLFPAAGYTKLNLVRYYLAVADGALRAAGNRPNVLVRYPNGIDGEFFYQKRAPSSRPSWIDVVALKFPSGRTAEEVVPRDAAALAWMANLACLELPSAPGPGR